MKQQEVFKKIGVIIKELNDQYEYLKTVDGPLNELELELFLANSHFLGDHVTILSKLNTQNSAAKKATEKPAEKAVEKPETASHEQKFFEPLVQAPRFTRAAEKPEPIDDNNPVPQISLDTSGSGDSYSFIREDEPETIRHELILDEADWEEEDESYINEELKNPVEEEIETPPVPEIKAEHKEIEPPPVPEVIAEKEEIEIPPLPEIEAVKAETVTPPIPEVKEEQKPEPVIETPPVQPAKAAEKEEVLTVNERMSAKLNEGRGMAEQLHADSITDLKKAINLNDKLLYIKDLFNGYSLAYSEAIEILNRFTGMEEAELFLNKNYAVKNNWANKPETTQKFYAILKRRYA